MNSQDSMLERATASFQSTSRGSQLVMLLALIIAVLLLFQYGNRSGTTEFCNLLADCQLGRPDVHRIEMAFSQAKLDDYEIRDGKLFVPRYEKSVYLNALADHNGIPAQIGIAQDEAPAINPFMSRSQQKVLVAAEKKKQLRQMIMQLPFVEQAWLEIDSQQGHSAFAPATQSALISVQPPKSKALASHQIETIRQMVSAGLAGIQREQIVITDVNIGRAYHANDVPVGGQSSAHLASWTAQAYDLQVQTENRVRQALADFEGIELQIQVHSEPTAPIQQANKIAVQATPTPPKENARSRTDFARVAVAGTNGKASIDDELSFQSSMPVMQAQRRVENEQVNLEQNVAARLPVNRVSVAVTVPEAMVLSRFQRQSDTPIWEMNPAVTNEQLQKDFEAIRTEIVERVAPCLPAQSFDRQLGYPVTVELVKGQTDVASSAWGQFWQTKLQPFLQKHWPAISVVLIGLMLLSLLKRSSVEPISPVETLMDRGDTLTVASKSEVLESIEPPVFEDAEGEGDVLVGDEPEVENDRGADAALIARKQLAAAIDNDPEATAQVIKTWIRDAA